MINTITSILIAFAITSFNTYASSLGQDFYIGKDVFKGVTLEKSSSIYREVECYQRRAYKRCPSQICQKIWLNQGLKLMKVYKDKYGNNALIDVTGGKNGKKQYCK